MFVAADYVCTAIIEGNSLYAAVEELKIGFLKPCNGHMNFCNHKIDLCYCISSRKPQYSINILTRFQSIPRTKDTGKDFTRFYADGH